MSALYKVKFNVFGIAYVVAENAAEAEAKTLATIISEDDPTQVYVVERLTGQVIL